MIFRLKAMLKNAIDYTKPHIHLKNKTIFVDESYWEKFSIEKFKNIDTEYDIVSGNIMQIKKKDRNRIIAYIGSPEKSILKDMHQLRWLQIASHGYNGYEKSSLYASNMVNVTNLKDVFSEPIAQYCVAAYYYFNCYALRRLGRRNLTLDTCHFIEKPVVIIFGAGNIGNCIAKHCKDNSWTVYGVKRTLGKKSDVFDELCTFQESLNLLSQADYVINILPENDDTINIFDCNFFQKMKNTAIFCNVGRGTCVVEEDLEDAVSSNIIRGAILDASVKKHFNSDRIIVTHHMSSISYENANAYDKYFTRQLMLFLEGKTPENNITMK